MNMNSSHESNKLTIPLNISPTETKKTIWLIRHAQSVANRDRIIQGHLDTDLTDLGYEQARLTGLYFEENKEAFQIKHIFASDLKRTQQTGKFISDNLGIPIQIDPSLREAFFGKWEGIHSPTLALEDQENYGKWMNNKRWRPEWCESFDSLQKRGVQAIENIARNNLGNTVIVTHGGIIHSFALSLTQNLGEDPTVHNCGITKLKATFKENNEIDFQIEDFDYLAEGVLNTCLQFSSAA